MHRWLTPSDFHLESLLDCCPVAWIIQDQRSSYDWVPWNTRRVDRTISCRRTKREDCRHRDLFRTWDTRPIISVKNWLWEKVPEASFCFITSRYVFLTRWHLRERNISSCNIVRDMLRTRYLATQSCDAFGQEVSHVVSLELELSRSTIPIKVNSWDSKPCLWA